MLHTPPPLDIRLWGEQNQGRDSRRVKVPEVRDMGRVGAGVQGMEVGAGLARKTASTGGKQGGRHQGQQVCRELPGEPVPRSRPRSGLPLREQSPPSRPRGSARPTQTQSRPASPPPGTPSRPTRPDIIPCRSSYRAPQANRIKAATRWSSRTYSKITSGLGARSSQLSRTTR